MRPENDSDRRRNRAHNIYALTTLAAMITGLCVVGEMVDQRVANGIITEAVTNLVDEPLHGIKVGVHNAAEWVANHTPDH